MGYSRYCYSTRCQFDVLGEVVADITYYRAAPGAALYTGPHAFYPNQAFWSDPGSGGGPGEVPGFRRRWVDGSMPFRPGGSHYDGSELSFKLGQSPFTPGMDRAWTGIPADCAVGLQTSPCDATLPAGSWTPLGVPAPFGGVPAPWVASTEFLQGLPFGYLGTLTCDGSHPGTGRGIWSFDGPAGLVLYDAFPSPDRLGLLTCTPRGSVPSGWPTAFDSVYLPP